MKRLLAYISILLLTLPVKIQAQEYRLEATNISDELKTQIENILIVEGDTSEMRSAVSQLFASEGFLNPQLTFRTDDLKIIIQPGCRFSFGLIAINTDKGNVNFDPSAYLGAAFSEKKLSDLSEEIRNYFLDKGYAEVNVQIGELQMVKDKCIVNLRYEVNEGDLWIVNDVVFGSLKRVSPAYLQRLINFNDSLLVNSEVLQSMKEELFLSGFFDAVSDPILIKKGNQKQIYINLQERNANYLDGIIGYVPNNLGGGSFIGEGKVGLVNSIADGNRLDLLYQRLVLDNTRLNVDVEQDWLAGLPLGLQAGFSLFQQDTNYQSRIFSLGAEYYLSRKATLYADYQSTGVTASESVLTNRTEVDGGRAVTTIGFRFRSLNHPRVPSRGILFDLSFGTGIKRVEPDVGIALNTNRERINQRILHAQIQTYHPIGLPHLLHFSGMLHLTSADYFTEIDLMRFGGARSFRGYTEEQFFGSRVGWLNSEYRYLLDQESYLFVFNTTGAYYRPQLLTELNKQFEQADFLYSFGFGLSYSTRVGQLMFSYALSPQDELANGKVHFGIVTRL